MNTILLLLAVVSLALYNEAKRYCVDDADCDSLGKLICVKTACQWGTCGCAAGWTAKYLGSQLRFGCVPNRRIEEYCSTDGRDGVCLAPNSMCDQTTKRCKCKTGFVPSWGGEACIAEAQTTATCQGAAGSALTTCNTISFVDCFDSSSKSHSVIPGGSGTCACTNKQQLDFIMMHGFTSYWLAPTCRPIRIGDTCLRDPDCPYAGQNSTVGSYLHQGKCKKNVCVCDNSTVPNYKMDDCKEALSFGETCADVGLSGNKHCNGVKGLVCGDICDAQQFAKPLSEAPKKCVCGPYHITSATSCIKIEIGGPCFGDMNCKGVGPRGVCIDGICQNAGGRQVASVITSLTMFIMTYAIGFY